MFEGANKDTVVSLTMVEVAAECSGSTIYKRISEGLWTEPVARKRATSVERSIGWIAWEVNALLAARVDNKSDEEIRELVEQLEQARTLARPEQDRAPAMKSAEFFSINRPSQYSLEKIKENLQNTSDERLENSVSDLVRLGATGMYQAISASCEKGEKIVAKVLNKHHSSLSGQTNTDDD